ncbi:hypothetical protein RSOL_046150, partial [Rhizoctonia solani AG-3 Rhs1AP]
MTPRSHLNWYMHHTRFDCLFDDELEFPEDEGLYDGTVDDAYAAVLNARSSGETTEPALVEDEDESEYEYESEDDQAPVVLGSKISSRRHEEMGWE